MKTPAQWLDEIADSSESSGSHTLNCTCTRCSAGKLTLLTEADIAKIQQDVTDSLMRLLANNASPATCGEIGRILKQATG